MKNYENLCRLIRCLPLCVLVAWVVDLEFVGAADPGFRMERIDDRIQNTACEIGPDGHLYVVSMNYHGRTGSAHLTRYLLEPDGQPTGQKEVVYDWGADSAAQPIGLAFDPAATADDLVVWIALGESLQGHSGWSDAWAGRIFRARLPGHGSLAPVELELKITNLPHAFHTVNDITFGPDDRLYICVGSSTTLGWEPHVTEQLLSGAILQADVSRIEGVLDVKTADGGSYNPFLRDAPVKLYGTAIRQPYDCVWHQNGRLYACSNQNDVNGQTGAGGGVPEVLNVRPPEYLAIIEQGMTYGFPNASRGEFVLMGGNPTDGDDGWTEIGEYPVGVQPPRTFDPTLMHRIDDIGGGSADGIIAYRAGGALKDRIITCFYSAEKIYTFVVGEDGRVIDQEPLLNEESKPLRVPYPLDLCEHPTMGHLYVAAYGKQDKGEYGAVYFLERTEPMVEPSDLFVTPNVLVAEIVEGTTNWSGQIDVRSSQTDETEFTVSTSADWLDVTKLGAHEEGRQSFLLALNTVPPPGTHYADAMIEGNQGGRHSFSVRVNVAPIEDSFAISAGNSLASVAESFPVTLPLSGTAMSALRNVAVDVKWTLEAGDAEAVRFSDPKSLLGTATFTKPGRYVFLLEASRGKETRKASTTFLVDVPDNKAPELTIEADEEEISFGEEVVVKASAVDDGLPKEIGALTYRWSREGTGAGVVKFSANDQESTAARFSEPGAYRLRCVVSDGVQEAYRDIVIHVVQGRDG